MNYYQARQREDDKCWDWTCMNDGRVWRSGACAGDTKCQHKTKEEAQDHQAAYDRERIKKAERFEIDTKKGHACHVEGCDQKAFMKIRDGGFYTYELCPKHLDDLSWYSVSRVISSF